MIQFNVFHTSEYLVDSRYDIISHLPGEINKMIFGHLTLKELGYSQAVSESWQKVVVTSDVWREYCLYLQKDSSKRQKNKNRAPGEWYERFKTLYQRITQPNQHCYVKKIDPDGYRKIKSYDYLNGTLAIISNGLFDNSSSKGI